MRSTPLGLLLTVLIISSLATGCGNSRKSSLLLERQAVGPIEEGQYLAQSKSWTLSPTDQTTTQSGVTVEVKHASTEFQDDFFGNEELFGTWAGPSPFFPENLLFYVKIKNETGKRIYINPDEFVLVDDRRNQYHRIGIDHIDAFADFKSPVSPVRGVVRSARPGFYGFSLPIGELLAKKSQKPFALMKQSLLQPGYLYPGVTYDGLLVYWNPNVNANEFKLYLSNLKTQFNADDEAIAQADFVFEFDSIGSNGE